MEILRQSGSVKMRSKLYTVTVVVYLYWQERSRRLFQKTGRIVFLVIKECGRVILNRFSGL